MTTPRNNEGHIFAIGDVHGFADELKALLNKLPIRSDSLLVFLGDYIDRGPASSAVIDTLIELKKQCDVVTLLGNHEAMLIDFLEDPTSVKAGLFIYNGGSSTLASYADEDGNYMIPDEHVEFFRSLDTHYETDRYFFVHGGVPELPLESLDPALHREEMIWSRQILRTDYRWEKTIVHGHSPRPRVELLPWRINVDTGCGFRGGALSAVELPTGRVFSVPRIAGRRRVYLRNLRSRRRAVRFHGGLPVRVNVGDRMAFFETVDYSEIGMRLRCLSDVQPTMVEGDVITGEVGPQGLRSVAFRGQVVRRTRSPSGVQLGISIVDEDLPSVSRVHAAQARARAEAAAEPAPEPPPEQSSEAAPEAGRDGG